jgi:membrane-bound ClpP family serine protease
MMQPLCFVLAQAGNAPKDDGSALIVWALALIGLALMLFMIEVFVPSGGLLGIASAVSLVAGIILLFWENEVLGLIGATVSLIALPFAIGFAIKLWPNTPIGRVLTLNSPASRAEPHAADAPSKGASTGVGVSIGQQGRAVTEMRPVGTCVFEGRREECLAAGGLIEPDTPVEVIAIDGRQIKVRPVLS